MNLKKYLENATEKTIKQLSNTTFIITNNKINITEAKIKFHMLQFFGNPIKDKIFTAKLLINIKLNQKDILQFYIDCLNNILEESSSIDAEIMREIKVEIFYMISSKIKNNIDLLLFLSFDIFNNNIFFSIKTPDNSQNIIAYLKSLYQDINIKFLNIHKTGFWHPFITSVEAYIKNALIPKLKNNLN